VLPAIAQTLRAKLKGSSDFLSKINIIPATSTRPATGVRRPTSTR